MTQLARFGVSLEKDLLQRFDALLREQRFTNRSEAIRDCIRRQIVDRQWQSGGRVAGAITLTYDHHKRALVNRLMSIQHDFGELIISSQHVHLDHDRCLEVIVVQGPAQKVRKLADTLSAVKGVDHGTLSATSVGIDG